MTLTFDPGSHTYYHGGRVVPGVTTVLQALGGVYAGDPYYGELGSAVHQAIQYYDDGELDADSLDPVLAGYLSAWQSVVETYGIEVLRNEQPVFHPVYRYAGTPDKVCLARPLREPPPGWQDGESWPRRFILIDLKTGAPSLTHPPQLAAYAACLRYLDEPYDDVDEIWCVHLGPDGGWDIKNYTPVRAQAFSAFLGALTMNQWGETWQQQLQTLAPTS